ncbi:tyrosine phosphatase family protein [uncultured Enterovirga sp.]|uniref:tyrosine phosphatase family protein n=1 Tax=uncultured Enterovirga sp. TaxID=2026352 RepID=UPI0035CA1F83
MTRIVVCPTEHAVRSCEAFRPSHAVSLAAPGGAVPDLACENRLVLLFNDIAEPRPGLAAPCRDDIAALLAFGASWTGAAPLLVHCQVGISRSTATAFILACQREPDRTEIAVAEVLRAASPCATPNPLMVALADDLLGRAGRMVDAVRRIGRGADYRSYERFELRLAARGPSTPV